MNAARQPYVRRLLSSVPIRSQVISDLVTHSLELGVYCSDFHIKTQNRITEDICDCSHICDSWLHLELSTAYFNETPRLLK